MIADLAIHAPNRKGDSRNVHAHILLTMRHLTHDGFGNKAREWNAKANIYQWRKAWEVHCNEHLKQAGLDCRVDCRSLAAKGLDQEPKLHLGAYATLLERQGIASDRGNQNREIEKRNELRKALHRESDNIIQKIARLDEKLNELNELKHSALLEHDEVLNPLDAQWGLIDELLNLSETMQHETVAMRKQFVEQCAESFNSYKQQVETYIAHVTDQKTQDRLVLQAKLYQAKFAQLYHTELANLLTVEDKTANAQQIHQLNYLATKAERDYKSCMTQWAVKAVRDDSYSYELLEQRYIDIVNRLKIAEQKHWSRFYDKVKSNDWSDDKIVIEQQRLVLALDNELARYFGLSRGYER